MHKKSGDKDISEPVLEEKTNILNSEPKEKVVEPEVKEEAPKPEVAPSTDPTPAQPETPSQSEEKPEEEAQPAETLAEVPAEQLAVETPTVEEAKIEETPVEATPTPSEDATEQKVDEPKTEETPIQETAPSKEKPEEEETPTVEEAKIEETPVEAAPTPSEETTEVAPSTEPTPTKPETPSQSEEKPEEEAKPTEQATKASAEAPKSEGDKKEVYDFEKRIAKKIAEAQKLDSKVTDGKQYVIFLVGDEEFALSINEVLEIIKVPELTRIPNCESYVEGVINLRGRVHTVVNLAKKLSLQAAPYGNNTRIIVVENEGQVIGLIIDAVFQVLRVDERSIQDPPAVITQKIGSDYITKVIVIGERLIIVLDSKKLLGLNKKVGKEKSKEAVAFKAL
ncbi:hypothetical protein GOV05_01210 [Candidatus Woesearchaeota archaeon]|nr:hypothetical protein [Candidatus Woesearchaeota archaeon]